MSTLYVIGVGPGDPELLTLKAARLIRDVPVIFVPKGREEGKSIALSIVSKIMDIGNKDVIELHFPMKKTIYMHEEEKGKWLELSKEIARSLDKGSMAAFLTLGDPSFYSTFFYLYENLLSLKPELRIEIVPGVSSINASAALAAIPLGMANERIAIIPANYWFKAQKPSSKAERHNSQADIPKNGRAEDFGSSVIPGFSTALPHHCFTDLSYITTFDTLIFIKVEKVFENLKRFLLERRLIESSVYITRAGMDNEKIIHDLRRVKNEDLDYFSMVIVKNCVIK